MPPALPDPGPLADRLRVNTTDGAAVLARQALAMLREYAGAAGSEDGPRILRCAEALRDARPSMGAVGRILQYWIDTLPPDDASAGESAVAHCDAVSSLADAALKDTLRLARQRLAATPGIILTHSASSTVLRALSERPAGDIVVTASEPGGEGRRAAARMGARCVEDADIEQVVPACAAVFVGADAIGRRAFVNKVGTRALAVAAQAVGRPFLVAAESFKRVDADVPPVTEDLFERVPNGLVTAFLTDDRFPLGSAR